MNKITMHIDLETYSPVDIKTAGAYRYAEEAEILLFGFSFDDGPVFVRDLTKEDLNPRIISYLTDPNYIKVAHNAPFEMAVLSNYYGVELDPAQWRCTAVLCSVAGYPMALGEAAKALELPVEKDTAGKALIRYFCIPCKPTKTNGGRTRNLPEHDPVKWAQFIEYCRQDIVTEKAIDKKLDWIVITPEERLLWEIDYKINSKGVKVDLAMARNAVAMDTEYKERLIEEAVELTGLANANSPAQLKEWLSIETDSNVTSLTKDSVKKMLGEVEDEVVKRVLELRVEMSKSSVKKYTAMLKSAGKGDRVRGTLQFYGAGRTGRWAGRLIQVQNFPRISMKDEAISLARKIVVDKDLELLDICFDSVTDVLSQLIRSALIPAKNHEFVIVDYASIESRIIAWLAGEQWVLDVFNTHGKIYEATASKMFKIPLESIGKNSPERQKGKIGTLLLGYQGGVGALLKMGAIEMGLTEEELPAIVAGWREVNPNIVKFWYHLQRCAIQCIKTGQTIPVDVKKKISFSFKKGALLMNLPSGRSLYYPKAFVTSDEMGRDKIRFWAVDQTTRKWSLSDTYGGKLAENITQAVARDCMATGLINLYKSDYRTVMSVHDEAVCEMPIGKGSVAEMIELMCKKAPWMGTLPLKAEGTISPYYTK